MCINICTKFHLSFRRTWFVQRHLTRIYISLVDYNLFVLAQKKWDWSLWPFSFAIFAISFKKKYPIINHICQSFVHGLSGKRKNKRTSLKTISQCHVMDPDGKIQYTCSVTCQILNYWEEFQRSTIQKIGNFSTRLAPRTVKSVLTNLHFYPFVYCAYLFPV